MDLIRKIIGLLSFTGGQGDPAGKGVEASLAGDACLSDELLEAMQTNNELLLQLMNDILDLSKIEAGVLEFNYSQVDVNGMLQDIEHSAKLRLKEGKINIAIADCLPECIIRAERNRLMQVLANFVNNAVKFTPTGDIRIGYRLQADNRSIRFYVSDTGIGIPKDMQGKIFERFVKLDSMAQGTGLGLTICLMIVEKLGGEIGVDSEPGKGSTFWFTLPCEVIRLRAPEAERTPVPFAPAPRLIRQEDRKVPIVALTAYAYPEDKKRAEEEGCNAFLTKLIDRKQLWEVLQELGL